jgi:hypothetical protein
MIGWILFGEWLSALCCILYQFPNPALLILMLTNCMLFYQLDRLDNLKEEIERRKER